MDDLERTLSDLAAAMQGHRQALAGREAPAPPARATATDSRTALLARLLGHIEAYAGLRVDEAVQAKLRTALSSVGLVELSNWITGLEARDRDHPHWLTLLENLTTNETILLETAEQTIEEVSAFGLHHLPAVLHIGPHNPTWKHVILFTQPTLLLALVFAATTRTVHTSYTRDQYDALNKSK